MNRPCKNWGSFPNDHVRARLERSQGVSLPILYDARELLPAAGLAVVAFRHHAFAMHLTHAAQKGLWIICWDSAAHVCKFRRFVDAAQRSLLLQRLVQDARPCKSKQMVCEEDYVGRWSKRILYSAEAWRPLRRTRPAHHLPLCRWRRAAFGPAAVIRKRAVRSLPFLLRMRNVSASRSA